MKTVFNNSELFHIFASESQTEGRNGSGSMSFHSNRAYSYAAVIGQRVISEGKTTYVLTTRRHSVTTTDHQCRLRRAVVGNGDILYVHDLKGWSLQLIAYENTINGLEVKLSTANKVNAPNVRVQLQQAHDYIVESAKAYSLLDGCTYAAPEAPVFTPEQLAETARLTRLVQAVKRDAEKAKKEINAQNAYDACTAWRENKPVNRYHLRDASCMLRMSKDATAVETSHGAQIPTSHAVRLWPLVGRARYVNKSYEVPQKLGVYSLTSISPNGDIVVGCHKIAYAEIARIAAQLRLEGAV